MPLTREERKLLHQKSKQPTLGVGSPDNQEGYDGDISFRQIEGSGTVEYVKQSNEWVAVASSGEMPPVRIIGGTRGSAVGTGSGITSHGALSGLGDDDHTTYILVDGTRAFSGRAIVDDTTEATSTTDGSLQTDGGLSVAKSAVIGDDLDLLSNSAIFKVGSDQPFTLTHANANNTLTATANHRLAFGDAGEYIYGDGTDMKIISSGDVDMTATLFDVTGAITASGIIKTDDTTEATSTTDGSLQTDGGLSVVKSVVIGDDLDLLSDSCIINVGSTSKFTLTDQSSNNCLMATADHRLAFGDAGEYIYGDGTDMKIISSGDLDITATLVDITGALTASGKITIGADDDVDSTITRKTHSDEAGGKLLIKAGSATAGQTNKAGGNLEIFAGVGTGSASGGDMLFKVAPAGSGGSSLNTVYTALTIAQSRQSTFAGDVVLEGGAGALQFTYAGNNTIKIVDNQANALVIENSVGGSDFMIFTTTNSGEKITSNKDFYVSEIRDVSSIYAETEADMNFYLRYDDAGSSGDVAFQFYDYNTGFLDITYTSNLAIIKTSGSGVNLEINSRGGDITFKDDSTSSMIFDMNTTAGATYIQNGAGNAVVAIDDGDQRLYFYDKGGEYIVGDGTDITIASGADIILDATGGNFEFKDAGTTQITIDVDGTVGDIDIDLEVNGDDLVFNQYNGNEILRLKHEEVIVIRNCYIDDFAVNIKPEGSGRHYASGTADYEENYSMHGAHFLQSDANTYDSSFNDWK